MLCLVLSTYFAGLNGDLECMGTLEVALRRGLEGPSFGASDLGLPGGICHMIYLKKENA